LRNNSEVGIQRVVNPEPALIKNDEKSFTLLCRALGDAVSFAILKSTMKQSKSATQISKACQIPVSSVYKKIKKLHHLGIVFIDRIDIDNKNGKKITFYKSRIRSLELNLTSDGETSLRIETLISHPDYEECKSNSDLFLSDITRQ
jgi:predicted transcriptional regulator